MRLIEIKSTRTLARDIRAHLIQKKTVKRQGKLKNCKAYVRVRQQCLRVRVRVTMCQCWRVCSGMRVCDYDGVFKCLRRKRKRERERL